MVALYTCLDANSNMAHRLGKPQQKSGARENSHRLV